MAQNTTILNSVREQTLQILESGNIDGRGADAYTLAIDLKMDRANVSRALNKLWRDGLLIKFQGKPTLFLDRKLVSEYHPGFFIPQTVAKGEVLSNLIKASDSRKQSDRAIFLEELIGADTSLKEIIALAKASVSYPPYGLHTLLCGSTGVGKSKFAHCMYLYKKTLVSSDSAVPFIPVTCHSFSDNPKLFSQQLLGLARDVVSNKSRRGFLDAAKGGILFFDGIEYLSPASMELIASVITKNYYNRIGDTSLRDIQCMIIASTTCKSSNDPIRILAERFPSAISVPDLEDRGIHEKIELIIQLFSEEARTIHLPIKISKDAVSCLAAMNYTRNIIQLTNEIKTACSRAYLDSLSNHCRTVYVHLHDLSQELLSFTDCTANKQDLVRHILEEIPDQYIELDQNGGSKYLNSFKSAPSISEASHQQLLENHLSMDIESIDNIYQTVVDNIARLSNCRDTELHAIKRNIYPIVFQIVIAQLQKKGKFDESKKHIHLLYGILLHITNFLKRADSHSLPDPDEAPAASVDSFPEEYQMALDIMENLSQIYSCYFSNREIDYLASYFAIFSNWITTVNLGLLVICHGETIASDMVSYALKTIYDDYIIDYINFSSAMSLKECLDLAVEKAKQLNRGSGILIFTDMEPLTTINEYITRQTGIDTNILYPVTLPLLLQTIRQILSNRSDFSLLTPASQTHSTRAANLSSQEAFIQNLVDKVISKTTVFLDTTKAVNVLEKCLKATLLDLKIPYSNEIAAKYLCHCCNMLERAIRGETWSYSRLNGFTTENHELMYTVEHKLEYAENIFGIKIPASEIAYITEIFME
ncbi:MAG: sigma 54-interacting transcriptional regulator [Hungatella sp.]|nr:sigma 54-interacting transcriptional regulator [Hungatella sp.]